ncbi:MAG: flavin reductase family protein [Candidatus Odinarchaeia archaeon]
MKKSLGANTYLNPAPVWVIGTYDKNGKPNLMTASWTGICNSNPPCVYVSLRKATYTYENILYRKAYTVNIPSEFHVKTADFVGTVSGRTVDKFSESGLTPIKSTMVDAPYVKEYPVVVECKLLRNIELGLHTMFIGEILDVKADTSVLGSNGLPNMEKLKPFLYSPTDSKYYKINSLLGKAFSIWKDA